jgi:hypothetical protein
VAEGLAIAALVIGYLFMAITAFIIKLGADTNNWPLHKTANAMVREGLRPKHTLVQARLNAQRIQTQRIRSSAAAVSFEQHKAQGTSNHLAPAPAT